jgi:hypothetical protein
MSATQARLDFERFVALRATLHERLDASAAQVDEWIETYQKAADHPALLKLAPLLEYRRLQLTALAALDEAFVEAHQPDLSVPEFEVFLVRRSMLLERLDASAAQVDNLIESYQKAPDTALLARLTALLQYRRGQLAELAALDEAFVEFLLGSDSVERMRSDGAHLPLSPPLPPPPGPMPV